jgi:hypothetical protein
MKIVKAAQHIKRMRGGAQSHLVRTQDGGYYVVKSPVNPQHRRVLANEAFATRLAARAGLPVPEVAAVEISDWLLAQSPDLRIATGSQITIPEPGLWFGSKFVADIDRDTIFDYLPEEHMCRVRNIAEFAGMLCIDKWTCNSDGRQAVFSRKPRERKYQATFIDQGYCFNAGEWNFPDSPLRGVYARNNVYEHVTGWQSFEPWLSQVECLTTTEIEWCAAGIPFEWYGQADDLSCLSEKLYARRAKVRELITQFRKSVRDPFPYWSGATA